MRPPDEELPLEPPATPSDLDINRQLLAQLMRGSIDAKIDFNPKIFHQKFVIRDAGKPRAAVLTGSADFTGTDTHRNFNHVVIFHHNGVVTAYQTEFDALTQAVVQSGRVRIAANAQEAGT